MPDSPAPADPQQPGAAGSNPTTGGRRRRRRRVVLPLVGVLVVLLAAAGVYAWTLDRSLTRNITRGIDLPGGDPTAAGGSPRPSEAPPTGSLNYVLLGSDTRDPGSQEGRSDSIMVAHLNADRDQASIISFPRDMWVTIPGHGKDKINAAYSLGGPALTVKTLESLTGVRMDHVVLVDFEGFIALTEDLGGVTVTNRTAFRSHGFTYPEGKVRLAGEKALWFVRERHALPEGDLDRAENQRKVIKAILAKALSAGVVADPVRFSGFVGNLARHLTVDNGLSDAEIRSTALSLRLRASDIELLQAPLSGFGTAPDGESIDVVDTRKLDELSEALRDDTMDAYLEKYPEG